MGVRLAATETTPFFDQIPGRGANVEGVADDIRGGFDTRFRMSLTAPSQPPFTILRLALNNEQAEAAMGRALTMVENGTGPYSLATNSCTTNCRLVLQAAGLQPAWWARSPTLLQYWSRTQEAQ